MLSVFEEKILPRLLTTSDETKKYLLFTARLNSFLEERAPLYLATTVN
jgi:hypothetical protein